MRHPRLLARAIAGRVVHAAALASALVGAPVGAQAVAPAPAAAPETRALLGTWRVDLRPDPTAAAAEAPFVVSAAPGDSLVGTFYGSPIHQARVNRAWGRLQVAFVTYDNSGMYHHTAVLVAADRLEGTSHALGRGFLAVWRAARADAAAPVRPTADPR